MRIFSVWTAVLIWSCVFLPSLEADVLKWVDDDGTTYYSDLPLKGIEFEWVEDGEKSYFSYEPTNEKKNKKPQVLPSRSILPKSIQKPKKVHKDYGQAILERPPARQYPSGRASTERISTERTSARGGSSGRTSTERIFTERTSARGGSSGRTSTERYSSGR